MAMSVTVRHSRAEVNELTVNRDDCLRPNNIKIVHSRGSPVVKGFAVLPRIGLDKYVGYAVAKEWTN